MNNRLTEAYISILKEELLMATGCTEPIAIAYCAAKMRDILGGEPERIEAEVSGNILKNVKSVIVPNTGGLKGINAAIAAGIIAGRAEKVLQVISYVTQEEHSRIREYMEVTPLAVSCSDNGRMLDIRLTGIQGRRQRNGTYSQQPLQHNTRGEERRSPHGASPVRLRRG